MLNILKEKEFQIWSILSILILTTWVITIGIFYDNYKSEQNTFLNSELERFSGEVYSTLTSYEEFANYIFDEIEQDEETISILHQANFATETKKDILRKQLYDKFSKQYQQMRKYKFRQFHFHLPTTESFLRVHLPDRYGDLLLDTREGVRLVNEKRIKVSGFEEGKIFNGFRNIYPLEYEGEHIGSVEISMSSASIIEVLSQLHNEKDFYFVIDQDIVQESLFEDQLKNYRNSNIFKDYYVDVGVDELTKNNKIVNNQNKEIFFKEINKKYLGKIKNKESFTIVHQFKGKDYKVNFLSIDNILEVPSAYLISISEYPKGYSRFVKNMYKEIILASFLALIIITFSLLITIYQKKLRNSAELDYLTNIYNRNKFYQLAEREMKLAKNQEIELALLLLDIDFFKEINDSCGHEWGDEVLKELANEISARVQENDVFARWGGEEFVLLLVNKDKEKAMKVAEDIRKLIDQSKLEKLQAVTVSIGVTVINPETLDINDALHQADVGMYKAKRKGRNQVSFQ